MQRVQHLLHEDHIKFLDEHNQLDRSEHIRRAVGDYIAKIKKLERQISPSPSVSVITKGESHGDNIFQSSSSEKY
jgi:metal-responsive CopG/Arc/MetJ family transcriptional regulator